jgi:hypothetical protein
MNRLFKKEYSSPTTTIASSTRIGLGSNAVETS